MQTAGHPAHHAEVGPGLIVSRVSVKRVDQQIGLMKKKRAMIFSQASI